MSLSPMHSLCGCEVLLQRSPYALGMRCPELTPAHYAMSEYAATRLVPLYRTSPQHPRQPPAILIRMRYASCGTDVGYAATQYRQCD
eukprot:281877-Rhodomonas_salina.5